MPQQTTRFEAIGTKWRISVHDTLDDASWQALTAAMHQRIEQFDVTYSRFRADSLVSRMAQRAGRYDLPADGYALLQTYERLYEATKGRVTPLIGQTMADAGYDATYSFATKPLTPPPVWAEVIAYDKTSLTLARPALLDFGAAGKGYLVDIIGALLSAAGLHTFVIDAGGDILQRSASDEPLAIGLENPHDTSEAIGVAQLCNRSLCASAGSKRQWGTFHHIIDPQRLVSPHEVVASWVIADDTLTADGVATALFFTEAAQLRHQFVFSYALLTKDMQLTHSADFPVRVFEAQS